MKRVYHFMLLSLLVTLSGCVVNGPNSAQIQTRVRRDGSVARRIEFAFKQPVHEVREWCALPQPPQWKVKTFPKTLRALDEGTEVSEYRYTASRDFSSSRQRHTDFIIRPFKSSSPLGKFEGKNEWQVIRRRGLFYTTYTYKEVLRFPGLREAYMKGLTQAVCDHLAQELQASDAERKRLLPEVQRAVEQALVKWNLLLESASIPALITASFPPSLRHIHPRGWKERKGTSWLEVAVKEAYDKFCETTYKDKEDQALLLYSFSTLLPGQITRASGQIVSSNQVRWNIVVGSEFIFDTYVLFAESTVRQVNWLALLSLLVLIALPVSGIVSFFRRYRLILRVARKTRW